jgi:chloramphenicol 3-O-phosphotransferase
LSYISRDKAVVESTHTVSRQQPAIPVLVITGPVGVGKTSVAAAMSELLANATLAHALIDLDWLRWCSPSPSDDPFHIDLGLANLALVWANYYAAGAQRLILTDIVESRALLAQYQAAIPAASITVVRLQASLATIQRRLTGREVGSSLAWHQQRAAELVAQWDAQPVEDLRVDTEEKSALAIAEEILTRSQWLATHDM